MSTLVIYHGNCYDGFTAAWVAREALKDRVEDLEFHAGVYGEDPPDVTGKDVYIVDFSYPRDVIEEMHERAASLRVLDHHKTAEAALAGLDYCTFDMERSGCRLAWDHFFPRQKPPYVLRLIEDRDLWRFAYGPDTRNAGAFVASLKMTWAEWSRLMEMPIGDLLVRGATVAQYIDRYCENALPSSYVVPWLTPFGRLDAAVVNVPYQSASEMANRMLSHHSYVAFAAAWFIRGDGRAQFSLRSNAPFDVSEIAKTFGGGGHAQAAGFDLPASAALALVMKRGDDDLG